MPTLLELPPELLLELVQILVDDAAAEIRREVARDSEVAMTDIDDLPLHQPPQIPPAPAPAPPPPPPPPPPLDDDDDEDSDDVYDPNNSDDRSEEGYVVLDYELDQHNKYCIIRSSLEAMPSFLLNFSLTNKRIFSIVAPYFDELIVMVTEARQRRQTGMAHDSTRSTPLQIAARNNNLPLARRLVGLQVDVNFRRTDFCGCVYDLVKLQSFSALTLAVREGLPEMTELLLDAGAEINYCEYPSGRAALHHAAKRGNIDVLNLLLCRGADINVRTVNFGMGQHALARGDFDVDRTPLFFAVMAGNLEAVRRLVAAGADVHALDERGRTALHCLGRGDFLAIATLLIEAGLSLDAVDRKGQTGLYYAAEHGLLEAVKFYLANVPGIATARDGNLRTPLHVLGRTAQVVEVAKALLDAGVDIEARDVGERTPLCKAARDGNVELVRLLVQNGARKDARDEDGKIPYNYAKIFYSQSVKTALERLLKGR